MQSSTDAIERPQRTGHERIEDRIGRFLAGGSVEVAAAGGGGGRAGGLPPPPAASPLSSAQISPQQIVDDGPTISYAKGGRFVKVRIPGAPPRGRGDRKPISGFSARSRRALLTVVNSIDQTRVGPGQFRFITLTYPKAFASVKASKRDLDTIVKRFERTWGRHAIIWKLEPQKRGAPHFHLLTMMGNADQQQLEAELKWWADNWHDIAGGGDPCHLKWHMGQLGNRPCVEVVKDWQGVASYAGKYLGKVSKGDEEWKHPGRYWGKRHAELLPITIVEESVEVAIAAKVRRQCVRWYEHQAATRYYVPGKKRKPGYCLYAKDVVGDSRVADCIDYLREVLEVDVRPQRRRWPCSRGGCSMFMPVATFLRIIVWAEGEFVALPS
jgi:hypothetical protein